MPLIKFTGFLQKIIYCTLNFESKHTPMKLLVYTLFAAILFGQPGTKTNHVMEQRLSFITIGAKDFTSLKQFYIDKFKWVPIKDDGGIVFLR